MFPSGMQTYHEGMPIISRSSSEVVSKLPNHKVNFIFQCTCITLESDFDFFRSLVTKSDLLIQYPNAGRLIDNLPAWLAWRTRKCFKPEAHLLIEKFLSLKKGRSRDIFIANMMEHTRARHEESISIF